MTVSIPYKTFHKDSHKKTIKELLYMAEKYDSKIGVQLIRTKKAFLEITGTYVKDFDQLLDDVVREVHGIGGK